MSPKLLLAAGSLALAATLPAQFTLVAPNGYSAAEGASNNAFPFNRGTAVMRFIQIYDSSHFTAQGVNSPILISQMRFRANATAATWAGGTYPNAVINMSTAALDYLAASTTFASNHGPDLRTVANGLTISGGTGNGTTTPGPWYITIPISPAFLYDPTSGSDLAFEVVLDTTGWSGASTACDAVSGATATPAPPVGTRIYATTLTATTGTLGLNHMLVSEFTYVPAAGLWPAFSANVTTGASPLAVQFTDQTYTSDPGGVLAWAWDFDNDTVVDSTVQNPMHTYTACGTYTVSLQVFDATNPPQTLTRTNYIVTDAVNADFSYALIAPNTVQFTDTSVPTPTTWAWDLDGDTIVDSTAQNPVWVYPSTAAVNVTLTASRLCGAPDVATKSVIPALVLQTIFTGGNGLSGAGAGNVFDLDVTASTGINITGITMAPLGSLALGTPITCEIWVTDAAGGIMGGTPVNHSVQGLWRLAATGSALFQGSSSSTAPVPTPMTLNQRFFLPPGSYSMGVRMMECGVAYTNGNGTTVPGSGTNQTYSNGDLTIRAGIGKSPLFATGGNNPRVWNGSISYDKPNFGGLSGLGFFGAGCPNSLLQISKQAITGLPTLGSTMSVTYDNLPLSAMINALGFSNTTSAFGPLPLDLGAFGAPGCPGRVSADATTLLIGAGNMATYSLALPNNPVLQGTPVFLQGFVLDPTANTLGVVTSDATGGVVGI